MNQQGVNLNISNRNSFGAGVNGTTTVNGNKVIS